MLWQSIIDKLDAYLIQFPEQDTGDSDDDENEDDAKPVDLADRQRRTRCMVELAGSLNGVIDEDDSKSEVIKKLADAARQEAWRIPIADSGVLELLLPILDDEKASKPCRDQVLRLVGNCCADTNHNRAIIVSCNTITVLKTYLDNSDSSKHLVLHVLHNICVDYEPAQKQAAESLISQSLLKLLEQWDLVKGHISTVCHLLDMLISQPYCQEHDNDDAVTLLCRSALEREHADADDFITLSTTAANYLQYPRFQEHVITVEINMTAGIDIFAVLDVLESSYTRSDTIEEADLEALRVKMITALSEVSALDSFTTRYSPISNFAIRMRKWLDSEHVQLQICACIMLGNIGRSDISSIQLVEQLRIQIPLVKLLETAKSPNLLFALLSFLKNLALASTNKISLGDAGCIESLTRFWQLDTQPQTQYLTLSLLRLLCAGCETNIRRICDFENGSEGVSSDEPRSSKLSMLTALFDRTNDEPSKMEITRLYTVLIRFFCATPMSATSDSSNTDMTQQDAHALGFWQDHSILTQIIVYMLCQEKWPAIRSEAWFILGLLTRHIEGRRVVVGVLDNQDALNLLKSEIDENEANLLSDTETTETTTGDAVVEDVTGVASQARQPPPIANLENILVMLTELLTAYQSATSPIELTDERLSALQELSKRGGRTLVQRKARMD